MTNSSKKNLSAHIFSIQKSDTSIISSLNVDVIYKEILNEINVQNIVFKSIKPILIKSNIRSTIISEFRKTLTKNSGYLFIELLNKDFISRDFEEIFGSIIFSINSFTSIKILSIALVNKSLLHNTINFNELKSVCFSKKIALLFIDTHSNKKIYIQVINKAELTSKSLRFTIETNSKEKESKNIKLLENKDIILDFHKIFDHFEINIENNLYHTPVLASLEKLSSNPGFINRIYSDIRANLKSRSFLIKTFGIDNGSINNVAFELTRFENNKIVTYAKDISECSSLLILCDFLTSYYPIPEFIKEAYNKGINEILILGIEKFKNFNITPTKKLSILFYNDTNYVSYDKNELKNCIFCQQKENLLKGSDFEDFENQLKNFSSVKFWEFMKQKDSYFESKHWISPTTGYHYLFRPLTYNFIKENLYNITTRFYNILKEQKFDENSIAKILCPEEASALILSEGLAEKWRLDKEKDIISIPRKYLKSFAGTELSIGLINYLLNKGLKIYPKQNVLVVDQAAHNYKTLTALERISKSLQGNAIGSLVFIDRTKEEIFLRYDNKVPPYYFSLYRWPIQPLEPNHCPCIR